MSLLSRLFPYKMLSNKLIPSLQAARGNMETPFPSDFTETEIALINDVQLKTMTSPERLVSLIRSLDHLVSQGTAGDIVECGVWKGGSMMLVAKRLLQLGDTGRRLFLFDTFEGMSEPDERDVSAVDNRAAKDLLSESERLDGNNVWCYSSLDEVQANLRSTGYSMNNISFIKGKVEDTLPEKSIGKIALLRLDTDWYESTLHELETLYDQVVPGGIVIIDDYGHWSGCRKAVDEFIAKRKLNVFLNRIDYTARSFVKNNL